jgi:hypothetical protein
MEMYFNISGCKWFCDIIAIKIVIKVRENKLVKNLKTVINSKMRF